MTNAQGDEFECENEKLHILLFRYDAYGEDLSNVLQLCFGDLGFVIMAGNYWNGLPVAHHLLLDCHFISYYYLLLQQAWFTKEPRM